ncbi:MAG: lipase family protein [Pirellulales bacterium]
MPNKLVTIIPILYLQLDRFQPFCLWTTFMTTPFDRKLARLSLEICRYTYAVGVGTAANMPDRDDALRYINNYIAQLPEPQKSFTTTPVHIHGSETSFACVVPFADRNVVSYMGTKTEFRAVKLSQFIDLLKNGSAFSIATQAIGFVKEFSQSLHDWGRNGRAAPVDFTLSGEHIGKENGVTLEGKVHAGFLSELKDVQAQIVSILDQDVNKNNGTRRKVLVTGHSQGGAEAALATRALAAAGFEVEATYTFAAPRTGTQAFVDSIKTPVYRFEFGDDIVPHLPPTLIRKMIERYVDEQRELLTKLTLWDNVQNSLNNLKDFGYVGLGPLYYGAPLEKKLHIGLSAATEKALEQQRLKQLEQNPKHWGDHHHLAGTTAEVTADPAQRGNYTLLASPEPLGWPLA